MSQSRGYDSSIEPLGQARRRVSAPPMFHVYPPCQRAQSILTAQSRRPYEARAVAELEGRAAGAAAAVDAAVK